MKPVIELKSLTKMYGTSRGIQNVTLSVPQGSVFGFLGPNGAGKTTTISILVDFIRATSGDAKLFGLDSREGSLEIHRRLGFLAGDMALDRGLTGWQQLEYLGNLRGSFDKAYVRELAKRLDCNLNRKFKKLSRGNKQKVGLIAALMHRPELLVLDEPTSGLDPLIQAEFNKIILDHRDNGGTTFISSHVLSEVQEICDTVGFIREGKLVDVRPITAIAHEAPRRLTLGSTDKTVAAQLKKLAGIKSVSSKAGLITADFSGDVNQLLRLLAKHKLQHFSLHEADLETTFMQYYEDEANHA